MESCLNFLIVIYYITEIEKLTIWISRAASKVWNCKIWTPRRCQPSHRWPGRNMRQVKTSAGWVLGGVRWHGALICFLLLFLRLQNPWKWSSYLSPHMFVSWTVLTWYQGTWGSWGWWCCPGCSWWCCGRAGVSPGCGSRYTLSGPPPVCCGTNLKHPAEIKNWPMSDLS